MSSELKNVENYWDTHHLGTQFIEENSSIEVGSREYFLKFDEAMERWSYKNELIDQIASSHKNGKLLEVGCGLGQDLAKFGKKGLQVTGIDLANSVVTMASKHLQAYDLKGNFLQASAENLSFPDNSFYVVYSCGVLQHTPASLRPRFSIRTNLPVTSYIFMFTSVFFVSWYGIHVSGLKGFG